MKTKAPVPIPRPHRREPYSALHTDLAERQEAVHESVAYHHEIGVSCDTDEAREFNELCRHRRDRR